MIDTKIAIACGCGYLKGTPLPPAIVHMNGKDEHMAGYCVVGGKVLPEKHILETVTHPRDPDARAEAVFYCGKWEECSGSGKHGPYYSRSESDCRKCCEGFDRDQEYYNKTERY